MPSNVNRSTRSAPPVKLLVSLRLPPSVTWAVLSKMSVTTVPGKRLVVVRLVIVVEPETCIVFPVSVRVEALATVPPTAEAQATAVTAPPAVLTLPLPLTEQSLVDALLAHLDRVQAAKLLSLAHRLVKANAKETT